jgi:hypothetical protein
VSGLAVLAAVLVALGGGAALRERSSAIDEAASASAHLVLLQRVQTNLVQADADATNSFLGFGLESVPQRLDYIASVQAASQQLALAAKASPADATALAQANADLTRYTGYMSSARAYNRLGKPVGANYLSTASDLLRSGVLPQLEARSAADVKRVDSAYSRSSHATWWLVLFAVIGIGALIGTQVYLIRHFHRIVNLPLVAASVGLLVVLILAAVAMGVAQSRANNVRGGALSNATQLSSSRVAAFDAKSIESLTLIERGSSTAQDADWAKAMGEATASLPSGNDAAAKALNAYSTAHKAINTLAVRGDWKGAVNSAIASGSSSANATFQVYAQQTETALNSQADATASGLDKAANPLLPAGILVVLIGLLAAVGAWWGVALRLDEYR